MSTSLRTRVRGPRAGVARTRRQYLLLALAAAALVALVLFAVGELVSDSISEHCPSAGTTAGAPPAC